MFIRYYLSFIPKEPAFSFCIIRYSQQPINQEKFYETCEELCSTTYERRARLEEAPKKTDCLTAVYYLVKKVMAIELTIKRIGSMPGILANHPERKWSVIDITREDALQPGDLLFLQSKGHRRLITHLAVFLNSQFVFHSSKEKGGGTAELLTEVFKRYSPLSNGIEMINYQDPRREITPKKEFTTPKQTRPGLKRNCSAEALSDTKRRLNFEPLELPEAAASS